MSIRRATAYPPLKSRLYHVLLALYFIENQLRAYAARLQIRLLCNLMTHN